MPTRRFVRVVFLAFLSSACMGPAQQVTRELIFQPGSTSFPSSHASTVVALKDGTLQAAWFGGTWEGKPDVAIWGAHRTAGGWPAPVELAREPGVPCWNPVLFHTIDGRLWLYYKFGPSVQEWTAARKYSDDEGLTWSSSEHLPAGLVGPVRAKPFVMPDGTIVSGSSVESYRSWAVWIERSADGGKTFAKLGPFEPARSAALPGGAGIAPPQAPGANDTQLIFGIIQPSVVSMGGKHLRYYARSTRLIGRVVAADSMDAGLTWTVPHPLEVKNPNSGIDAVTLKDGRVVMIYNDTTVGRSPLNLAVSRDGEHFTMFYTLESGPGEYSYPALIQDANGDLDMTYTWNRKSIMHVHFPLSKVPKP